MIQTISRRPSECPPSNAVSRFAATGSDDDTILWEIPKARTMPRIHSWLSPKCVVRMSPRGGMGVFAAEPIAERELVAVWGGRIYTTEEILVNPEKNPNLASHAVQVHDGFLLGQLHEEDMLDDTEVMNHSCDPNVGIKGQIVLLARRPIAIGEEVCFDYETTQTEMSPFECNCGAPTCRRMIDGSSWRNSAFRKSNRGWFSWHIEEHFKSK